MFRGNQPTRIDEKGRLKVPADFRSQLVPDGEGKVWFYVTSKDGERAEMWPIAAWEVARGAEPADDRGQGDGAVGCRHGKSVGAGDLERFVPSPQGGHRGGTRWRHRDMCQFF